MNEGLRDKKIDCTLDFLVEITGFISSYLESRDPHFKCCLNQKLSELQSAKELFGDESE